MTIDTTTRPVGAEHRSHRFAAILCAAVVAWGSATARAQEDVSAPVPEPATPVLVDDEAAAPEPADEAARPRQGGVPLEPLAILDELRWYLIPFAIASVLALWFAIERLVVLRRGRVIPRAFVERFLAQLRDRRLDADSALEVCEENGSPVAQVFEHGIRKWGKPSVEVEQAIIDGGERQVAQLRKNLRVLNGVATVTPLMGLLGTVIGMIHAFNEIANSDAMGKADELAGGIALALLTTAAGLTIAIPSLITYMYLAGRVDSLVVEMDHLAQNVVHLISAEGLSPRAQRRTRDGEPAAKETIPPPEKKRAV